MVGRVKAEDGAHGDAVRGQLIIRDPRKVPCVTDKYWATFAQLPASELAYPATPYPPEDLVSPRIPSAKPVVAKASPRTPTPAVEKLVPATPTFAVFVAVATPTTPPPVA